MVTLKISMHLAKVKVKESMEVKGKTPENAGFVEAKDISAETADLPKQTSFENKVL